jgi:hypothetical protein
MPTLPENLQVAAPQQSQPELEIASSAPKKSEFSKQGISQAYQQEIQKAQQLGVQPAMFVQLGNFAEQAAKDSALYPIFTKALIDQKLADPEDLQKGIDYQMLSHFVILGKVAEQMTKGMT